ncbi:DUF6281 family protein [Streptomyces sp. NPDC054884]|uniref:DUF6281 family protein n=1 Tax=Streptomyces sp. ME08-AFT2 TaxID=3028683 RepID=UPI0029A11A7C|nr:DUF6281 family protein [Streptomyces sp. ME08-AFT2]MDX3309217.1 DUF6281 family protein [Streptomyces sp. ME08-AFT2]
MSRAITRARNAKKILVVTAAFAALTVGCSSTASDDASPKSPSGKAVSRTTAQNAAPVVPDAVCAEPLVAASGTGSRAGGSVPVGCDDSGAATKSETPQVAGACAVQVEFAGRVYTGITVDRDVKAGHRVGKAVHVACADTPGDDNDGLVPQPESRAYAIPGVDPGTAVAVGDSADTMQIYVAEPGKPLPAEIQKLITS